MDSLGFFWGFSEDSWRILGGFSAFSNTSQQFMTLGFLFYGRLRFSRYSAVILSDSIGFYWILLDSTGFNPILPEPVQQNFKYL